MGKSDVPNGITSVPKSLADKRFNNEAAVPENLIKNIEKFIKDAAKPDRNGLSKVGRSLQKHSTRKGSPFNKKKFSHKNADKLGEKVLRDILDSKKLDVKNNANGTKFIFDKNTGRGFSISRNGEFNGFRELDKVVVE